MSKVEWKKLGEICEIKGRIGFRGYTREDQVEKGKGAISLSPGNIENGSMNYETCTYITWDKYEESPEIIVNDGDIILCKTASVGKVARIKKLPEKATINPQLVLIKNIQTDPQYLFYVLEDNPFQSKIKGLAGIGSVPNVSQAKLSAIEVPIPSFDEQNRIVGILDTFTSSIENLKEQIALRRKQYEYYRDQLLDLEGKEGVEMKTLGDICINCDKKRKPITSSQRKPGIYPYYGASGIVDYVEGYIFDGEYLLVSEDGANLVARTTPIAFSIKGKNWVNNHAHVLAFDSKTTQKFVEIYLNKIDLTPWINGAAQPKLNQANLNLIDIPVPTLSEQQRIVGILDVFEESIQNLEAQLAGREKQYEYYRNKLLTFE